MSIHNKVSVCLMLWAILFYLVGDKSMSMWVASVGTVHLVTLLVVKSKED